MEDSCNTSSLSAAILIVGTVYIMIMYFCRSDSYKNLLYQVETHLPQHKKKIASIKYIGPLLEVGILCSNALQAVRLLQNGDRSIFHSCVFAYLYAVVLSVYMVFAILWAHTAGPDLKDHMSVSDWSLLGSGVASLAMFGAACSNGFDNNDSLDILAATAYNAIKYNFFDGLFWGVLKYRARQKKLQQHRQRSIMLTDWTSK